MAVVTAMLIFLQAPERRKRVPIGNREETIISTGNLVIHRLVSLAVFLCAPCNLVSAIDYPVASALDISLTLPSLRPGDSLVMQDGVWTSQRINFSAAGTQELPITLRPETPGGVILNGFSSLNITGDWLVADGLRFEGGSLPASDHVVEFRGNRGNATNSRLTNSTIVDYNPDSIDTRYFGVSMYGQNNRVDHNYFAGQNHSGVTVVVWRSSSSEDHHRIDSNHFGARPAGNGNGFEAIRVGTSDRSLSDSFTVVENNLFEHVDGEIEIISNKSGNNTYRYNTFRQSSGTLTLRHGNDNRVEGNFFLGQGKDGSGGVRVIGERQTIVNNYFQGLDGRADGAISVSAGVVDSPLNGYFQVKDTVIAHNTIVDVQESAVTFDHGFGSSSRTLLAENVTLANNLVRSSSDALFEGRQGTGWTVEGNIAFGNSLGSLSGNPGVQIVDPQLTLESNGLWRPTVDSPVIDGAVGDYSSFTTLDMDGQPRVGLFDVGADEFSSATIVRKPLESGDVGPNWTIEADFESCLRTARAIQAEDYGVILDPDADNVNWVTESSDDALGGQSMRSPLHDLVERPADPHESLLVYDVQFSEEGTYTAYFRGRGFDSGSDSIFVADAFGTDPESIEILTDDGVFQWEVGETFEITSADVDVPLEFRVGSRERFADFDAFVFHTNSNLNATELDSLFDIECDLIDLNDDQAISCADVDGLVAAISAASTDLEFDMNGDGVVDRADLNDWLTHAGAANLDSPRAYSDGDANLDGLVDAADLSTWTSNSFGSGGAWCSADFNADGVTDGSDFNLWNSNRTSEAAEHTVPEPSDWVMLASCVCGLILRRHGRTS